MNKKLALQSCGLALPSKKLTNSDFEKMVDTSDEWIRQRTGIVNRFITEDETARDLAIRAAKNCLADLPAEEIAQIGVVLVATTSHHLVFPNLASALPAALGLPEDVMALDLNAACSGFVYALELARSLLLNRRTGSKALIIGAEVLSRLIDYTDRSTCILFGDGAGATLWTLIDGETDYFASGTRSDSEHLYCNPGEKLYMDGRSVFRFAVSVLPSLIQNVAAKAGLEVADIDLLLLHQANARIIEKVARDLRIEPEKAPIEIENIGNTSAASLPILLTQLWQQGQLQEEKTICLAGFGAGLSYGAILLKGHHIYVAQ